MYFEDLSPYTYISSINSPNQVNIGWLDTAFSFSTEDVDESFLDRLWAYCNIAVAQTRGFHSCNICQIRQFSPYEASYKNRQLILGSAEIRVFGSEGRVYASPNLIFHYIKDHKYRPSKEFVDAVLYSPASTSEKYFTMLADCGFVWRKLTATEAI